jgi:hypothetical protein
VLRAAVSAGRLPGRQGGQRGCARPSLRRSASRLRLYCPLADRAMLNTAWIGFASRHAERLAEPSEDEYSAIFFSHGIHDPTGTPATPLGF